MWKIDTVIREVQVYNTYLKQFRTGDVYLKEGKILYVDTTGKDKQEAKSVIEGRNRYMVPGLVDIHMHIESSMLTPQVFCKEVARCGVTTIVSEPHEMANVNGVDGILDMIHAGKEAPIDVFYGIPSSVPSTSDMLETTGGTLNSEDMSLLMQQEAVICVGEVMNYRQIIQENSLEITKFLKKLKKIEPHFTIEGHCPSLVDLDLAKFLYLGINGDHTEHSLEELKQRFENGMYVELQDKMIKKEVLDYIMEHHLEEFFGFVTDDVMADTLYEAGQLDVLLRKAIAFGMPAEQVIYNATYTNAQRMHLTDRGSLAPGKLADFVLLEDIQTFRISATYKNGICIYHRGDEKEKQESCQPMFPEAYYQSIKCKPLKEQDFVLHATGDEVLVRVMQVQDKSTQTKEMHVSLPVKQGIVQWEESGVQLAIVAERYGKTGEKGYGFVNGDAIKQGAVATTYAHDHHNLLVVGSNAKDMRLAANRVIAMQGGIVVTKEGEIQEELPLPIGGILSDQSAEVVGKGLKHIRQALKRQGYQHYNEIMSLCTLSLPVSPQLKITDKGLIDVKQGKIVSWKL